MEGIDQLADALDLRAQVFGHLGAGAFVLREEVVAEGFAGIKGHRQIFRFFLLEQAQHHTGKTQHAGGWLAAGGLHAVCWRQVRAKYVR